MSKVIMSWSKCKIEVGKTGANDAMAAELTSVGIINDKSTSLAAEDGEKLTATATGGVVVAEEEGEPVLTLTTRIKEMSFEKEAAFTGATIQETAAVQAGYHDAESGDAGALKVVASGASTGEINLASVVPYRGSKELAANDYVVLKTAAEATSELTVKTNVVADDYSVKVTPKNIGAVGIKIRRTHVSFRPGYSEEEGHFVDLTFKVMVCEDGELYKKFKVKESDWAN